ncbi:MAG: hypothetical protein ACRD1T_02320, partial [Acidimicrobiia bacterium]
MGSKGVRGTSIALPERANKRLDARVFARHIEGWVSEPYRCIIIAYLGISGSLQGFEVMQQLFLGRGIGGHTEG